MTTARLMIRKALVGVQGKMRPLIQVAAEVDPALATVLNEHFPTDPLFKRSFFASGPPPGVKPPSGPLGPMLMNFVKNDACPEVTVKSILAGQVYQGNTIWDIACFEYIAQRSFDALLEICKVASELGRETLYIGDVDVEGFNADTIAEARALAEIARAA